MLYYTYVRTLVRETIQSCSKFFSPYLSCYLWLYSIMYFKLDNVTTIMHWGCIYVAVTKPTASRCMHLLHWGSYKALWNVEPLIRGQSLCTVNATSKWLFAVVSPRIHSILSLLLPQSCSDVYPTSLPVQSGARGHSVSLLALTVVLALIKYFTASESTSLYAYTASELTHCVLCVLLYSSTVIALPVCAMSGV